MPTLQIMNMGERENADDKSIENIFSKLKAESFPNLAKEMPSRTQTRQNQERGYPGKALVLNTK